MRKPDRPGHVMFLAIVQFLVGGLLVGCGACGMFANVESSATITVRTPDGKTTTQTYDTRAEMERVAPGYRVFLVGSTVVALVLSLLMVVGAVGLLGVRAWGWWISLLWAVLQLLYQIAMAGYLWTVCMPAANRVVRAAPHDINHATGAMVNGNTFYHLFWALFSSGFVLYPLLILLLLLLPATTRAFRPRAPEDRDAEEDRRDRRRWEDEEDDRPRRPPRDDDDRIQRRPPP